VAAGLVGDDLGVAGLDAVDDQIGDGGRAGLGDVEVAGHAGVHVADVQGGHSGALPRQLRAQGLVSQDSTDRMFSTAPLPRAPAAGEGPGNVASRDPGNSGRSPAWRRQTRAWIVGIG
jgi:hypothetical protein